MTDRPDVVNIILDTDPGIDDAMALAFLGAHPRVRLMAITTVFGNADVATTTRNAHLLKERFGLAAPVHAGAAVPLAGASGKAAAHVHGHDALGDIGLTDGFPAAPAGPPAHLAMIDLVRRNPGQITIVAIGPLTNLALALQAGPSIADLVCDVVVMGGAFGWGPRRGNVTPLAEANIHNDPEAAALVFKAPWPVRVVGLDVTLNCVLNNAQARQLTRDAGASGQLLWDISRRYEALYREHDGLDGCALHDVAAAICAVEPGFFGYEAGGVHVDTRGEARGQTTLDPAIIPAQRACRRVDADAVVALYMDTLTRLGTKAKAAS